MIYKIQYTETADKGIDIIKKSNQSAYKKFSKILPELENHPRTGIGKPEKLKHYKGDVWSRRLTEKHRLLYQINDKEIVVLILAATEHYEDK
jgi:toxin YoeB